MAKIIYKPEAALASRKGAETPFTVGQKVKAVWPGDGKWYEGTIRRSAGRTATVKWDDGSAPSVVTFDKIKPLKASPSRGFGPRAKLEQAKEIIERSAKEAFAANKAWTREERLDYVRNLASKAYGLKDAQRSELYEWCTALVDSMTPAKAGSVKFATRDQLRKLGSSADAKVRAHPAVESVDDGGKGEYFVNLKPGYQWSGQRSFGVDSATEALKMLKAVTKEATPAGPVKQDDLIKDSLDDASPGEITRTAMAYDLENPFIYSSDNWLFFEFGKWAKKQGLPHLFKNVSKSRGYSVKADGIVYKWDDRLWETRAVMSFIVQK